MTDEWPHDPDGEAGSEGMRKYGQAVLAKKVDEDEDFPLDAGEFLDAVGEHPVRVSHDRVVSVAAVFEHVDEEEFETMTEFHRAVGRGMRKGGMWPYEPSET